MTGKGKFIYFFFFFFSQDLKVKFGWFDMQMKVLAANTIRDHGMFLFS